MASQSSLRQPVVVDSAERRLSVLAERCRALLHHRSVAEFCDVRVERRDRWTIFEGCVDSHVTKVSLFGLVPNDAGARWIVDRLRIGMSR